jgi:hypothetical protein
MVYIALITGALIFLGFACLSSEPGHFKVQLWIPFFTEEVQERALRELVQFPVVNVSSYPLDRCGTNSRMLHATALVDVRQWRELSALVDSIRDSYAPGLLIRIAHGGRFSPGMPMRCYRPPTEYPTVIETDDRSLARPERLAFVW